MNSNVEQDFTDKKMDLSLWKRLYAYAFKNRLYVFAVMAALAVVSVIDVLYPLFTSYAIDHFIIPRNTEGLSTFAILYGAAVVLQASCLFIHIAASGKIEMMMSYDIRQEAFLKLQTLSFSFYDRTAVGFLMARMVGDVSRLSELVAWSIVDVLWSVLYILGSIVAMFMLSWKLALVVLLVLPPLTIISIRLQKRILKYQRQARKQNSRITGAFNEGIMGAVTTKTLVLEDRNAESFHSLTAEMRHISVKSALVSASFFPIIMSLGAIGTAVALSLGGAGVIDGSHAFIGAITTGTLVAFISYSLQLFDPIQQLAGILAELLSAQASAERVLSLIDTPSDIVDSPEVIEKYGDILHPRRENWEPIRGNITFDHVSFSYKKDEAVIKDFSLDVRAGQSIALVGETGAGKSTIINLLCRFYEPTEGEIRIDGTDYRKRSQLWLQSNLGYVLQTPHLFSGSIRDIIRFGRPDATDDEVRAAAQMVHAESFILRQSEGYDTDVGEGGALLSTGQKQLISFARVIMKDPRIFVLDEATSSIDTETEQLIQNAITSVLKNRTSFIVAHRLSTIRHADRILVVRNGLVVEDGTHETLMAQGGYYYDLYTQQFREQATLSTCR